MVRNPCNRSGTERASTLSATKPIRPAAVSAVPKGGKIRKAVGQGDVRVEAIGGQIVLNFRNGTTAARAKIDDLAMPGRAQRFSKKRHHQAMEAKGCLHEAKVIRREIANDSRKPGLVFQVEEMEP